MTDSVLDSRYSWFRLAVAVLIATVGNVGMWAVIVVMPDIQAEFSVDRATTSVPYVLTMVGFGLGNYYFGKIGDRLGISKSLITAAVIIAVGFAASAVSGDIYVLSFIHILIGFGTGASFGPLIADVSQWFQRRRGIAVGIAASGNYLSGAVWPLLLGGVLSDYGWRGVYWALAGCTIALLIPLSLLLRRKVPDEVTAHVTAVSAAKAGGVAFSPRTMQWLLAIAGVACCVAMSMPQVHIVSFCVDLGFGPAVGAEMLSLMLLAGVASRMVSGVLADEIGGVATLLIGSTLQCVALFLYLPFDGLVSLYIVSLVFGLSQGGIVPSYAIIVREYMPPNEAGERVGFVMMATILGMALGGWMSGWVYDLTGSYQWAFLNGIAWNFLNIAIIGFFFLRGKGSPTLRSAVAS